MTEFPAEYLSELVECLVGEELGKGAFRTVFRLRSSTYVAKIEAVGSFQNVLEWSLWQDAQGTPLCDWLAPCVSISSNGRLLIQAETQPLQGVALPEYVPAALADLKVQNFGVYQGRVVCHDYGLNHAFDIGARSKKMRPAKWWDGTRGRYLGEDRSVSF